MSDVPEVAKMFVHDHVLVKLANVWPREFVNMRTVDLSDRHSIHRVDVIATDVLAALKTLTLNRGWDLYWQKGQLLPLVAA